MDFSNVINIIRQAEGQMASARAKVVALRSTVHLLVSVFNAEPEMNFTAEHAEQIYSACDQILNIKEVSELEAQCVLMIDILQRESIELDRLFSLSLTYARMEYISKEDTRNLGMIVAEICSLLARVRSAQTSLGG